MKQFKLPDVGEGLTEAEIVSWKVKPGDTVKVNEIVVEIETAKSLVELPSPFAGVVTELLVRRGHDGRRRHADHHRRRRLGRRYAGRRRAAARRHGAGDPGRRRPIDTPTERPGGRARPDRRPGARRPHLGARRLRPARRPAPARRPRKGATPRRRVRRHRAAGRADLDDDHAGPGAGADGRRGARAAPAQTVAGDGDAGGAQVLAKPPVRKLAKDLGVDLATVDADRRRAASSPAPTSSRRPAAAPADRGGRPRRRTRRLRGSARRRVPVKGVRKMTAAGDGGVGVHRAARHRVGDRRRHRARWSSSSGCKSDREFRDVKVSPLLLVAKALILAVQRNPEINAAWDEAAQEIVVKHYVNLGIAAATPRGLVVPNIKDADRLSLRELAEALSALTATAREGRTQPADMAGGTITITNVGVFGVDAGTPILNPGEAAILCFGAVRDMPWVVDGEVVVAQGDPAGAVLRPPDGRRPARLAVPRRHRPRPRGPRHRPPLVARRRGSRPRKARRRTLQHACTRVVASLHVLYVVDSEPWRRWRG